MPNYTQAEIDRLISAPKSILEPPRKEMRLDGAHWRNEAKLVADSIGGTFAMFLRKNEDLPEKFSVGLRYMPKDDRGEIILLRCNGKHPFNEILILNTLISISTFTGRRRTHWKEGLGLRSLLLERPSTPPWRAPFSSLSRQSI